MCGICGILSFDGRPPDRDVLESIFHAFANSVASQRGWLADSHRHVRPAPVVDVDVGKQPLHNRQRVSLGQSGHLMTSLKLSTAAWLIADEESTRRRFAAARAKGVATVTGGTPFEVAVHQNLLPEYLEVCAELGADRIECARGFTEPDLQPEEIVGMAAKHGLGMDVELGSKHSGAFTPTVVDALVEEGRRWRDAGAHFLVIEARESAREIGLFDSSGNFDALAAERFVEAFGFDALLFEAPNKPSQFALLDHFGADVQLSNVRLEELLRVEMLSPSLCGWCLLALMSCAQGRNAYPAQSCGRPQAYLN